MVINRNLVEKKLVILGDFIRQIDQMDFDEIGLTEEKDIQQLLSFRLQQAVETAIDIATHLLAGLSLERKETAKDVFELMGKEKIISAELAKNMMLACDFRNLVVHGYQKIDFHRLFYDYKEDLEDLREFARQINNFLNKGR